jgi:hypothetical protein
MKRPIQNDLARRGHAVWHEYALALEAERDEYKAACIAHAGEHARNARKRDALEAERDKLARIVVERGKDISYVQAERGKLRELLLDVWNQFAYPSSSPSALHGRWAGGLSTLEMVENVLREEPVKQTWRLGPGDHGWAIYFDLREDE